MHILGISGSPRKEIRSAPVFIAWFKPLEHTGCDYELLSLRGKNIGGCIACLGCVSDNVCKVADRTNRHCSGPQWRPRHLFPTRAESGKACVVGLGNG